MPSMRTIIDGDGKTLHETKVNTNPVAIRRTLQGFADRLDRVGVEASSLGIWLFGAACAFANTPRYICRLRAAPLA